MLEIIIQGRGGQGAQTAGNLLAMAYFAEGRQVQAFASYGGARRGTPVSSFLRVDDRPVRLRCDIERADAILCFDASLLQGALLAAAHSETLIVVNSARSPAVSHAGIIAGALPSPQSMVQTGAARKPGALTVAAPRLAGMPIVIAGGVPVAMVGPSVGGPKKTHALGSGTGVPSMPSVPTAKSGAPSAFTSPSPASEPPANRPVVSPVKLQTGDEPRPVGPP